LYLTSAFHSIISGYIRISLELIVTEMLKSSRIVSTLDPQCMETLFKAADRIEPRSPDTGATDAIERGEHLGSTGGST
jgi:hypothetical protein